MAGRLLDGDERQRPLADELGLAQFGVEMVQKVPVGGRPVVGLLPVDVVWFAVEVAFDVNDARFRQRSLGRCAGSFVFRPRGGQRGRRGGGGAGRPLVGQVNGRRFAVGTEIDGQLDVRESGRQSAGFGRRSAHEAVAAVRKFDVVNGRIGQVLQLRLGHEQVAVLQFDGRRFAFGGRGLGRRGWRWGRHF